METLNLGCGTDYREGCVNVDLRREVKADVYGNAQDLPFKEGIVSKALVFSVLEHMPDLPKVLSDLARVVRRGGQLIVRVPHYTGTSSWANIEHVKSFSLGAWFNVDWEDPRWKLRSLELRPLMGKRGFKIPILRDGSKLRVSFFGAGRGIKAVLLERIAPLIGGFNEIYVELERA